MKTLTKIGVSAIGVLAFYLFAKFIWVLFWDVLWKIFYYLQTALMIGVVLAAVYVLWSILSYRATSDRD